MTINLPTRRTFLVASMATFSGCGLGPDEQEPIEAEASTAADLSESAASDAGFALVTEDSRTVETTLTADITGDVELSARRNVKATTFRRIYALDELTRFGIVTAPIVELLEGKDILRDPVLALDDARAIQFATERGIDDVDSAGELSIELLETTTNGSRFQGSIDGTTVTVVRGNVWAGEDGVTAMATAPADGSMPSLFEHVRRKK